MRDRGRNSLLMCPSPSLPSPEKDKRGQWATYTSLSSLPDPFACPQSRFYPLILPPAPPRWYPLCSSLFRQSSRSSAGSAPPARAWYKSRNSCDISISCLEDVSPSPPKRQSVMGHPRPPLPGPHPSPWEPGKASVPVLAPHPAPSPAAFRKP